MGRDDALPGRLRGDDVRTMKRYQIEDCGIDHAQYFPGRGVAYTDWSAAYVGAGNTPHEAAEDAIEQASSEWDTARVRNTLRKRIDSRQLHADDCPASRRYGAECTCAGYVELYCYAALYVR